MIDKRENQEKMANFNLERDAENLITEIENAFQGVERGSGLTLQQSTWTGNWVYRVKDSKSPEAVAEYEEACRASTDHSWDDIDFDVLEEYPVLTYLDVHGFRYYLPAFMRYAISRITAKSACSHALLELMVDLKFKTKNERVKEWRTARYRSLTDEQHQIVRNFLVFIINAAAEMKREVKDRQNRDRWLIYIAKDAKEALDSYWGVEKSDRV